MNWIIIIVGNLVMDASIALFAILSAFESRFLRLADLRQKELDFERQGTKGPHKLTEQDIKVIQTYGKASDISPFIKKRPFILSGFFAIGVILQLVGLYIEPF